MVDFGRGLERSGLLGQRPGPSGEESDAFDDGSRGSGVIGTCAAERATFLAEIGSCAGESAACAGESGRYSAESARCAARAVNGDALRSARLAQGAFGAGEMCGASRRAGTWVERATTHSRECATSPGGATRRLAQASGALAGASTLLEWTATALDEMTGASGRGTTAVARRGRCVDGMGRWECDARYRVDVACRACTRRLSWPSAGAVRSPLGAAAAWRWRCTPALGGVGRCSYEPHLP